MVRKISLSLIALMAVSAVGYAQTTKPVSNAVIKSLSTRAGQAYAAGQYAVALPLLQDLAEKVKDRPEELSAVREQIRVCQKQLDLPQTQWEDEVKTGENRKPHVRPADGKVMAFGTIKELGNFEYDAEKGGGIPKDVEALTGAKVKVKGFMIPLDQAENISQFALVPSLFACCFGQPPQIQHTIVVNCPPGKAVSYYPDEIAVEGVLTVKEKREDGYIVSVFEMSANSVTPAAK